MIQIVRASFGIPLTGFMDWLLLFLVGGFSFPKKYFGQRLHNLRAEVFGTIRVRPDADPRTTCGHVIVQKEQELLIEDFSEFPGRCEMTSLYRSEPAPKRYKILTAEQDQPITGDSTQTSVTVGPANVGSSFSSRALRCGEPS